MSSLPELCEITVTRSTDGKVFRYFRHENGTYYINATQECWKAVSGTPLNFQVKVRNPSGSSTPYSAMLFLNSAFALSNTAATSGTCTSILSYNTLMTPSSLYSNQLMKVNVHWGRPADIAADPNGPNVAHFEFNIYTASSSSEYCPEGSGNVPARPPTVNIGTAGYIIIGLLVAALISVAFFVFFKGRRKPKR